MKDRRKLKHLQKNYNRKIDRLEKIFDKCVLSQQKDRSDKHDLNYFSIELLNLLRAFNRAFLLSCAKGAVTAAGMKVFVPGVSDEFLFIQKVFSGYPRKSVDTINRAWDSRDEPAWESDFKKIAEHLNLANIASINNAYDITSFKKNLKIFRNYCAHRSKLLMVDVKNSALSFNVTGDSIEEILTALPPSPHPYIGKFWILQCRTFVDEMCK